MPCIHISGGLFAKTEMSEVMTEICKIDQNFNQEKFLKICEREIIPNVLEVCVIKENQLKLCSEMFTSQ